MSNWKSLLLAQARGHALWDGVPQGTDTGWAGPMHMESLQKSHCVHYTCEHCQGVAQGSPQNPKTTMGVLNTHSSSGEGDSDPLLTEIKAQHRSYGY